MKTKHLCPTCKGRKYVTKWGETAFFAVTTFGLIPLLNKLFNDNDPEMDTLKDRCWQCQGRGWVKFEDN